MTERADAVEQLALAIRDALDHGRPVPCTTDPALWTADQWGRDRLKAIQRACRRCAVHDDCADYVDRHPEPSGIYAGTTPKARSARRNTTRRTNQ